MNERFPELAHAMGAAATTFLASLDAIRRREVQFAFADQERFSWEYRPDGLSIRGETVWHNGLRLLNMSDAQQAAAYALLESGLSAHGAARVRAVMDLEASLRITERQGPIIPRAMRDPENFAFAIFGEPGGREPWGWRVGGHHIAVHLNVIDGDLVASTPFFLGANPAEVRHGPKVGTRTLSEEEDVGRDLLRSLDPTRRARAIVSVTAPHDILTDVHRMVRLDELPSGVRFGELSGDERVKLVKLLRLYTDRQADPIAEAMFRRIERTELGEVRFAWLGGAEQGEPHYYALKGKSFVVEYDKTQNQANHIHSVWRSLEGDFGEDLLAAHYHDAHAHEV